MHQWLDLYYNYFVFLSICRFMEIPISWYSEQEVAFTHNLISLLILILDLMLAWQGFQAYFGQDKNLECYLKEKVNGEIVHQKRAEKLISILIVF